VTTDWTAVIPVKRLGAAKTRLRGAVPVTRHRDLALAMLRDTAAAVLACPDVAELLVVTDDPEAAAAAAGMGARPVPDRPDTGLNDALRHGADVTAGLRRDRVVLTGDLPALRPDELSRALHGVHHRSFVPDATGTGTVLLAAPAGTPLDPHFGADSAAAHARSGAIPLGGDWPGLRQDVDTAADLRTVLALGPGPHTCALLRDLGLADCGSSRLPAA
jgi:2-phospho-L-lactate guanylyltransferase